MNREIKFRGKSTLDGKWVYGSYKRFYGYHVSDIHNHICTYDGANIYEVEENTVGQYTGLKDKNGKEVYEGDILDREGYWKMYIGFNDACFVMIPCDKIQRANWTWHTIGQSMIGNWEIIGNIYENPELLEEKS